MFFERLFYPTTRGRPRTLEPTSKLSAARIAAGRLRKNLDYWRLDDVHRWARVTRANSLKRARNRGLPHDLTRDDLIALLPDPLICPVLGIAMSIRAGATVTRRNSATIDRIDPTKGYTKDNVVVLSDLANRGKAHMTLEQCVLLGEWAEELLLYKED